MVRRAYVVAGLVALVVVGTLVLSATAAHPLLGASHLTPVGPTRLPTHAPPSTPPATASDSSQFPRWITVGATVLILLYAVSLLLLIALHRRGRPEPAESHITAAPDDPDDGVWQTLLSAQLSEAAAEQLVDIGLGTARDAIIACWLRLHAATRQAGLVPATYETPQEFTERTLRQLHVDESAVTTLAELYREARFSAHPMSDTQRQQAADALALLARELAGEHSGRAVPA